jgi:phosphatidylserine/phosphatidylglycerophosphate/cardiolipin synthase-like enzyme
MISVTSTVGMLAALRKARKVTFSSYFLKPGDVEDALIAAAARHADVEVRLDGDLYGGSRARDSDNRAAVAALRKAGAHVQVIHRGEGDGSAMHMKAAVCDGVAFLDDCNWSGKSDIIIRDDRPSHVRAIREAILRRDARSTGHLSLTKLDALRAEAAAIRSAGREVDVETEYLGNSSPVFHVLRVLLSKHVRCRILVSERAFKESTGTQSAAQKLATAGADVRLVKSSDKFAFAGAHAWVGSANATSAFPKPDDVEWSLTSHDAGVGRALRARFNAHWRQAKAIA